AYPGYGLALTSRRSAEPMRSPDKRSASGMPRMRRPLRPSHPLRPAAASRRTRRDSRNRPSPGRPIPRRELRSPDKRSASGMSHRRAHTLAPATALADEDAGHTLPDAGTHRSSGCPNSATSRLVWVRQSRPAHAPGRRMGHPVHPKGLAAPVESEKIDSWPGRRQPRARPPSWPLPQRAHSPMSKMNPVVRWFHQLGSPPYFDRFAARWAPWAFVSGLAMMAVGAYLGLFVVPADYQQGDSFRILYIHVPAAWMSMAMFALMALYGAIALVWRIKLCEILAMACAPIGAAFTFVTLATGSIWGKPMWGTWWDWDPRLTSQLVLLFLYFGVIGLYAAIEDSRAAARAASLLAIVGVVMLPIIRYSVVWWNSLHQGQT